MYATLYYYVSLVGGKELKGSSSTHTEIEGGGGQSEGGGESASSRTQLDGGKSGLKVPSKINLALDPTPSLRNFKQPVPSTRPRVSEIGERDLERMINVCVRGKL